MRGVRRSTAMTDTAKFLACAVAPLLLLGACAQPPSRENVTDANTAITAPEPSPADNVTPPAAAPTAAPASPKTLALEGLGDLKVGEAPPAAWAQRGAQTGDACRTVTSPAYPGVYAIVEGGKVRRITVGKRSDVTLVEGVGVGAPEAEVTAAFPGFRSEPHKYEDAPAKYLTAPHAGEDGPGLRFEIGHDGKVSAIHVGTMPTLAYVEGCS